MRTLENRKPDNHSSSPFFEPKIQKKLTTGTVGDKYEVEADNVADKVVNKQKGGGLLQSKAEDGVQRKPISETISTVQKQDLEQEKPVQKKGKEKEEEKKKVQKKANKEEDKKVQKKGKEKEEDKKKIQKKADKEEDKKIQKKVKGKEDDKKKTQKKADKDEDKKVQKKGKEKEDDKKKPVQKKSNNSESSVNNNKLESNLKSSKGGGSPLSKGVKSEMESGFGTDFSQVRIHTDSNATQMSQDLGAQAFTNGNDIYFNSGKYDANSQQGKHLLAHELTHTVQQSSNVQKKEQTQIQRSWLGDAWDSATDTVSDGWDAATGAVSDAASSVADTVSEGWDAATGAVSDAASSVASGLSSAWDTATTFLGDTASAAWEGMKSLGSDALDWLSGAASYVWDGIKWFGNQAWDIIKVIGTFLWDKLCLLGNNVWSFISNIPSRLWRIIVHGWDGITGILGWAWDGLSGAAGHLWQGVKGVFGWLGGGLMGAANWLLDGVVAGYDWAVDFVNAPSLSKLWNALTGTLGWVSKGISGFAQWGWDGVVGAAIWAWQGIKGFASWIWDGVLGGLTWAGKLLLYIIDLLGIFEILQLLWGLIFRMRKLTDVEINASLQVHPAGMIPYDLVYVDEGSLVAFISGYFSGGGYRAVTTAHIIHAAPGEDTATMVHELSHVAQYEHAGSVYMAQAIHAQAFGEGYNYTNTDGTFKHQHFNEFNREQQASICEDYYKALNGGGGRASAGALQPFVNEMRAGKF
ncbi:DUF4157 domain-containing protein [Flavobacterium sp. MMLR14_040]|uniref:eCIS core domain-containing protein n=1 Tax=Flavobacterium sp. MMLR14_040 TaxID=3093843 RepID=UPI00299044BC|nr:DUF4157 domain-containing protein [Flavobacterium sp. MMLR14_040]MDW8850064.1 DUF4157 domain-containing protein [Flavobacterium sp. MMLR14_040]